MNLQEIIKAENITLSIKSNDLAMFADQLAAKVIQGYKANSVPAPSDKYLTAEQVCEKLAISRVTLWSWDKKKITNPIRLGNLKRYKLSEIEAIGAKAV
jgi:predicted DNA-binding transcriptional regulator AlpA